MSHEITRAAASVEIDGEVLLLKLSVQAWREYPYARVDNSVRITYGTGCDGRGAGACLCGALWSGA
jgi:hypothetical protein